MVSKATRMLVFHVVDPLAPLPPLKGSPVALTTSITVLPDVPAYPTPIVRQFQYDRLPVLTIKFVDQGERPVSLFSEPDLTKTATVPGVSAAGFPRLQFLPTFERQVWLRIGKLGEPYLLETQMVLTPDPVEPLVTDPLGDFANWTPSGLAVYAWTALDLNEEGKHVGEVSWRHSYPAVSAMDDHEIEGTATTVGEFVVTITIPPATVDDLPTVLTYTLPVAIGDTGLDIALALLSAHVTNEIDLAVTPGALPGDPATLVYTMPAGDSGNDTAILWDLTNAPAGISLSADDLTCQNGKDIENFDRVIGQFKLAILPTVRATP